MTETGIMTPNLRYAILWCLVHPGIIRVHVPYTKFLSSPSSAISVAMLDKNNPTCPLSLASRLLARDQGADKVLAKMGTWTS